MSTTDDDGLEPTQPVEPVVADEPVAPVAADQPPPDRRPVIFVAAVLIVSLLVAAIGLAFADDDDDDDELAADETTSTTDDDRTTTTEALGTTTVATTATTTVLTGGVPGSTTTTAAVAATCRNSTDRACGSFRWDPAPGANQRMTLEVTVSPPNPRVGELVTFTFIVSDDATPRLERADYGDGTTPPLADSRCEGRPPEGFGPWTPPEQRPGSFTLTDQHVYSRPGTYLYRNAVNSSSWADRTPPGDSRRCPRDPYADSLIAEVTIPVS